MAGYAKGANAERELIRQLFAEGYAVARVAGSGATPLPAPDIVAVKQGLCLVIEAKAWNQAHLSIAREQMLELEGWAARAGGCPVIAWKIPRKGWRFLSAHDFTENAKFFVISQKTALAKGRVFGQGSGDFPAACAQKE